MKMLQENGITIFFEFGTKEYMICGFALKI